MATDDGIQLQVLNVTRVLDALDTERSKFWQAPEISDLVILDTPAFRESVVRDVPFFKLPHYTFEVFLGDPFVERMRAAGLRGLKAVPVWSPERGSIPRRLW